MSSDEHPVLDKSHLRVVYQGGQYVNSSTATAIDTASAPVTRQPAAIYDLQGRRINGAQRGVQIVRNADGTTRTVVVK